MDALRVAFAEEEDAVGGENTNANRPSRRRQTLSARCLNASAHVARPVVEGDDSDVVDVVPATARAARDAGYARVVSVDALAVDRESFLVTPNADGGANASSSSREAETTETTETTRVSARLGSLRCAFRRDTLDAAAALARRFRRVDGSPSRASPPPAAPRSSAPTAGTKPDRHAEAVGRPSGIRVRLDRVDPEAFAFAANRSTPSPRAVVSDTAALVSPRVIDDYYGPEREKAFFLSEKTPNAPERKTRKTADRVSVVGGVTFSPSFAAPAVSARELGPASFAKPASVRRAAARTVRASFANARASARSGTEYLENEKNSTPSSHRGTLKLRASGPAVESSMPTARWFDGAAPVATDAVRDAPTSGARREPRRSLRGGPKTDDAFQKAFHDAFQNASDAFRVPEASLEPLCAEGDRERTLTSAIVIEVANATLAIRPGLEWDNKKSGEKPKDDDCDGVRAAAADVSLRADAFGDAANPTNPTTRLRRRTSSLSDDDEERLSYDDDAHMAVSRLVTATVGDAAVFTRAAAQNAPTATLLAHDAGAGGTPASLAPAARSRALDSPRAAVERLRSFQKLPERLNDRTRERTRVFLRVSSRSAWCACPCVRVSTDAPRRSWRRFSTRAATRTTPTRDAKETVRKKTFFFTKRNVLLCWTCWTKTRISAKWTCVCPVCASTTPCAVSTPPRRWTRCAAARTPANPPSARAREKPTRKKIKKTANAASPPRSLWLWRCLTCFRSAASRSTWRRRFPAGRCAACAGCPRRRRRSRATGSSTSRARRRTSSCGGSRPRAPPRTSPRARGPSPRAPPGPPPRS